MTTSSAGAVTRASRSYGQPGAPMVTRTATSGATTGHQLSALLADHLGTANTAVALSSGQTVTRRAAKPYGELRGPKPASWPNKRGYIGVGIDDTTTGLTHIGAREYDQNSGRFISADPIMVMTDPLQMNGYAYSHNSPVSRSDPTGLLDLVKAEAQIAKQQQKQRAQYIKEKYTKVHDTVIIMYKRLSHVAGSASFLSSSGRWPWPGFGSAGRCGPRTGS